MERTAARGKQIPVFVPEGFTDFACEGCGECCREPGRITISSAKADRLARVLRDSGFPFPASDALMRDENAPDAGATFARVGDRCVFLTEDGRCYLLDVGVPELRGFWCMAFPFTPLTTPRGVNYAVSFACRKTVQLLCRKDPIRILVVTVDGTPPGADRPLRATHRIPVAPGRAKLDWSAHRLVEGMLLALASDWGVRLADRLLLMPMLLHHLLDDYAGPESNAGLRERLSAVSRELPLMAQAARAFRADPNAHYAALSALFARRLGLRAQTGPRTRIERALRLVRGRRTKVRSAELGVALAKLYTAHYTRSARRLEHILSNYVLCRAFASREMLTGGLYKGVATVAYLVAAIRFFATTAAAEQGATVNRKGLLDAVRFVEKTFGQSRNTFDFLDAPEQAERLLDPAAVAALVRI